MALDTLIGSSYYTLVRSNHLNIELSVLFGRCTRFMTGVMDFEDRLVPIGNP